MLGIDHDLLQREVENLGKAQHENIVRLLGYCDEEERVIVEHNGKQFAAFMFHKAICYEYTRNGSLDQLITDIHDGLEWHKRYKIIKGTCDGLRYLHDGLPSPILHLHLKPSNILLDEHMVPKIANADMSKLFRDENTIRTIGLLGEVGYLPPEYINYQIISTKFDIFSLGFIITETMAGERGRWLFIEMTPSQVIEHVLENWRARLQETLKGRSLERQCQQVRKCIEIAVACMEPDRHKRPNIGDIVRMLEETEMLEVHPMELRFALEPKKHVPCLLQLRNKQDDHVAFRLLSKSQRTFNHVELYGMVPPGCTYTLVLMTRKMLNPAGPDNDEGFVLSRVPVSDFHALVSRDYKNIFNNKAKESANDDEEVTLKCICAPPAEEDVSERAAHSNRERKCEHLRPDIEIITTLNAQKVLSVEVHPTEPWIMTTDEGGMLCIWNYRTMEVVNSFKDEPVYVAKFIARERWIVAGDGNGWIHVFSYGRACQDTTCFEAHEGRIMSLAVHPSDSCVLSSSHDDHLIKLWRWDQDWNFEKGVWVCTRTFEGHSDKVAQVLFNPQDPACFASASWDGTVKIWGLHSDLSNTVTFDKQLDGLTCVDYDNDHVVTGSKDGTVQIWNVKAVTCRDYLQGHARHVTVVYCHPKLQKLITGSLDGTVRIWDYNTRRLENIIALHLGEVFDVRYIEELQRIIVGCHQGIAMMVIKEAFGLRNDLILNDLVNHEFVSQI